jgi:hypothetical protein
MVVQATFDFRAGLGAKRIRWNRASRKFLRAVTERRGNLYLKGGDRFRATLKNMTGRPWFPSFPAWRCMRSRPSFPVKHEDRPLLSHVHE